MNKRIATLFFVFTCFLAGLGAMECCCPCGRDSSTSGKLPDGSAVAVHGLNPEEDEMFGEDEGAVCDKGDESMAAPEPSAPYAPAAPCEVVMERPCNTCKTIECSTLEDPHYLGGGSMVRGKVPCSWIYKFSHEEGPRDRVVSRSFKLATTIGKLKTILMRSANDSFVWYGLKECDLAIRCRDCGHLYENSDKLAGITPEVRNRFVFIVRKSPSSVQLAATGAVAPPAVVASRGGQSSSGWCGCCDGQDDTNCLWCAFWWHQKEDHGGGGDNEDHCCGC
jgi:hypothetical protein